MEVIFAVSVQIETVGIEPTPDGTESFCAPYTKFLKTEHIYFAKIWNAISAQWGK